MKNNRLIKLVCVLLVGTMLMGFASFASAADTGLDLSEHVKLVMYLYGSAGVANEDILAAINEKLTADINTEIEVKYIDWGDIGTKYPLLWAAGEPFDMAYSSLAATVPFYTLAKQGSLYDISDILDKYATTLKAAVSEGGWTAVSSEGGIYGVPTLGAGFNTYGFVYNRANCEAWGIDYVTDLDSMIAYLDAAVAHGIYPFNGGSELSMDFYRMLVDMTGKWVPAPGVSNDEMFLVADYDDYMNVIHPAFTDEFADFARMMDDWSKKGYWPTDIMSASLGDKELYGSGLSASYITHMADWTGNFTAVHGSLENQDPDAWYFAQDNNKVMQSAPSQDITVVNVASKYPERCVLAIEKFMTDESYYRLWQYGIEGRQYVIENGYTVRPEGYDEAKDGGGFAAWAFSNNEFTFPQASEHPSRYEKMAEWGKDENHINDPYTGFSFDATFVSPELSAISTVNSTLGIQLMLGKTNDVEQAIEDYRNQLKSAGIDYVIEELKNQLKEFTPIYDYSK